MSSTYTDLWKALSPDDRLKAAEAFWSDQTMRGQQQTTLQLMAKRYNFRLKSLQALPATRKAKMLLESSPTPEIVATLLAALHLTHRKDMLVTFLDAAEIPHENGVLAEEAEKMTPDPEKIKSAVEAIRAKFPAQDVDTYIEILYMQDPNYWSALQPFVPQKTT